MSKIRFHILLAALLVVTGCGEDDKVLPEQQQQFESFLSGSHQPRLVTEQEAMSSDEDLDFYSTFGRWSYRYIYHYYDSERQTRPEAEIGDEVDLVFWVYLFENRAITASTMPIYIQMPDRLVNLLPHVTESRLIILLFQNRGIFQNTLNRLILQIKDSHPHRKSQSSVQTK